MFSSIHSKNYHFHEHHCPREREPAHQGPATSDLDKLCFSQRLALPPEPEQRGCNGGLPRGMSRVVLGCSSRLRVTADRRKRRLARGVCQGWPAWPECWAPNACLKYRSMQWCLSDTQGRRRLQGRSRAQIQELRWAGEPLTHSRSPRSSGAMIQALKRSRAGLLACSLPKAQAALEEVGEGSRVPLHGMKRVSTPVITRAIRQQKRLRKTGKPQQGYLPPSRPVRPVSLTRASFSKEKETRCSGTPQREDKVTYHHRAHALGWRMARAFAVAQWLPGDTKTCCGCSANVGQV